MSTGMIVPGASKPNAVAFQDFVKSLGTNIARSGMFGCENQAQGEVLALACVVSGRDPLSLPMEYHLMKGKLTLRADAMLGRLSKAGGTYKVIEHSPDAAEVEMEFRGRKFHQRFTWQEAQQEPFVYEGKGIVKLLKEGKHDQLTLKDNYATPRRRMQQMWCRVVSDGVRVVAPELVTGAYTGEETADYTGFVLPPEAASKPVDVKTPSVTVTVDTRTMADVVDAECEPANSSALASPEQVKSINAMFDSLAMSAAVRAASVAKRGFDSLEDMPTSVAAELLDALTKRHSEIAKQSKPSEADTSKIAVEGPITKELLDRVVEEFKAAAQRDSSLVERVRAKLVESNMKISDLTYEQGRKLLVALKGEAIEAFFQMPLVKDLKVEPIDSDDPAPDV